MQERSDQMPASTSRAVRLDSFGGPEVLNIREVPAPQAGPGQIRVRVTAAGLNPMDWFMTADADTAARFGLSLPAGFGTDYAGVVDQVGDGVTGFAPGDRVFGGALSRAVADFVVVDAAGGIAANEAHQTPDGVDDRTAATLAIAGRTAAAALAVVDPGPGDTVLIGGAAGGVGVFAVQLARLAGARVIGTGSATSSDFLRGLGAEPVAYGDGLADRVRALAPGGVTAAIDLHGTETVHAARELGVPDARICTIAAQVDGGHARQRRQRRPRRPGRGRPPGRGGPAPGAHRGELPGRADPHRGRAPGRPARARQGRHRPLDSGSRGSRGQPRNHAQLAAGGAAMVKTWVAALP